MVRTRVSAARGFGIALAGMVFAAGGLAPTSAHAGKALTRLSAEATGIDGTVTDVPPTASPSTPASFVVLYSNSVKVPANVAADPPDNVIYVTIVGTAFSGGNGFALNCQVDGANCLAGTGTAGTGSVAAIPAGWIIPLGNEFSGGSGFGDTGFSYQWCAAISKSKKNVHSVVINAASAFGGSDAFIEAVQVFVDSNRINTRDGNVCGTYPTPNSISSPD